MIKISSNDTIFSQHTLNSDSNHNINSFSCLKVLILARNFIYRNHVFMTHSSETRAPRKGIWRWVTWVVHVRAVGVVTMACSPVARFLFVFALFYVTPLLLFLSVSPFCVTLFSLLSLLRSERRSVTFWLFAPSPAVKMFFDLFRLIFTERRPKLFKIYYRRNWLVMRTPSSGGFSSFRYNFSPLRVHNYLLDGISFSCINFTFIIAHSTHL